MNNTPQNPRPIIRNRYFKLTLAINISIKPLRKTKADVEKLFGKIKAQIKINGARTYNNKYLKSLMSFLYLLNCLAINNKIDNFAISDG